MAFGTLTAEFFTNANPPVSQGIITTVVDAGGGLAMNEAFEQNFCVLPNQMPVADHAKIVDGAICRVTISDTVAAGGSTDICTFIVKKKVVRKSGRNTFLHLSGPDQLSEMQTWLVNRIVSTEETGTAQATGGQSITLAVGTPDRTGWTVSVPAAAPHTQGVMIESHDTGSQVATLAAPWPAGTPASNTTYKLSEAIAQPNDLEFIASEMQPFFSSIWTLEVEGGNTGTVNGSYTVGKGESVLRILQMTQEQNGTEFFRLKSLTPSTRTVEWRRTSPSSGITITSDKSLYENAAYAVAQNMTAERVDRRFTRIYAYGAGMGPSAVNVYASTINPSTLYAGFALINDAAFPGIRNTNIETATFHRGAIKTFSEIQAANGSNTQLVSAANALMRAAASWLKQHDGYVWEYRCSVIAHTTLKPGDTINISWSDQGQNPQTITATGVYIQSVQTRVENGQKVCDLYLTEKLLPSNDDSQTTGKHIRTMLSTLRHSEASIGTAATGGGVIGAHDHAYLPLSGGNLTGNVTLDADVLVDGRDISDDGATLDTVAALAHSPMTVASSTPSGVLTESGQALTFNLTGSNIPTHEIIGKHTYAAGGSALDVVGLSAPTTLAMLTPSSNQSGGGSALLKSDANGDLKLRRMNVTGRYEMNNAHILSLQGTALFVANSNGLSTLTSGYGIVAIGDQAAGSVTSGNNILAIGSYSLNAITTQASLIGIGASAGQFSTSSQSVFIGNLAGAYQSGTQLTAIGDGAASGSGGVPVAANSSVVIGKETAKFFSGSNMVASGNQAIYNATSGGNSVVSGTLAAYNATAVTDSAIIGHNANYSNSSLSNVVSIGAFTNYSNSGAISNSIFIGNYSGYFETSNYRFHLSVSATTNPLLYGEFNNNLFRMAAQTIEMGDGTNATTLKARAADLTLDVAGGDFLMKSTTDISGESWTSGFLGSQWGIDTSTGHADFRSIYADELRVTHFIAETALTKAGSLWITKSQGTLTRDVTLGNVGASVTIYVEDMPGVPNTAVFANNDYILLRKFSTSGNSLIVASAWGQVTNYTDLADGEQSWTFTLKAGEAYNQTINSGSVALDFGQSGDGYITMTTLDNAGSPYAQIASWRGNPYTAGNRSVHTRWGNLDGLAGIGREYGIYAGVSPTSARIVATDTRVGLHSVPLSLYNGGDNANILIASVKLVSNLQASVRPNGDISATNTGGTGSPNYSQINNDTTGSYVLNNGNSTNADMWLDLASVTTGMTELNIVAYAYCLQAATTNDGVVLTAQIFKSDGATELTDEIMLANQSYDGNTVSFLSKKFGWVDSAASQSDWNGARLRLYWYYYPSSGESEVIRLDPFVPSIAVGDPLPTAVNTGDGFWVGRHTDGTYQLRVGKAGGQRLLWNSSSLGLYNAANEVVIDFAASGNAKISGILNLGTSGGIYQGTGTFASPTTGLKMWNDGGLGRIAGYNGGTLQAGFDTSGKLTAGAGTVILDSGGMKIVGEKIRIHDESDTTQIGTIGGALVGGLSILPTISVVADVATSNAIELIAYNSTNNVGTLLHAGASSRFFQVLINSSVEFEVDSARTQLYGYLKLEPQTATPANPLTSSDGNIYIKGGKLVVQYNNAGTIRYKYLDLTGTGVTWVHTTTAP